MEALWEAGGVPTLIPNLPEEAGPHILSRIDGLLLTGGGDVGPARYSEESHPHTNGVDELRDILEDRIIQAAISSGKPLLAICRGVQMLNVSLGGSLIQASPGCRASGSLAGAAGLRCPTRDPRREGIASRDDLRP